MNVKAKGYILGAIAAASYGMNPLFALPLYKNGMNPDSVLFSDTCSQSPSWQSWSGPAARVSAYNGIKSFR